MTYEQLLRYLSQSFQESLLPIILHYTVTWSPILLAIVLGNLFWKVWVRYVQIKNFNKTKYVVLELRLPKDTFKSPLAMETVLHSIHNTADGGPYTQYWEGATRPWYSLEIISIEGNVKFLIWTEDRRKNNLMSALYSQYPGIEIREIEDYAKSVQYDGKEWKIWAAEFEFTKKAKDFGDAYPIKTYVDYGLDKDPKEEFKVDPLTHVIEWLGSLRPNEQAWFQFVIRAHKGDQKMPGHLWKRGDLYKKAVEGAINKILMRDPKTKISGTPDEEGRVNIVTISKGEQDIVAAIERKATKLPFDVCIRTLYIAKKKSFDTPFGIGGIISSLKQFNSETLNGFKPSGKWTAKISDYPWQDYRSTRRDYISRGALRAYRRRSAFYPPYEYSKTVVLNTEELATMYHMPGAVAGTPGLARVPSRKGEAPVNLPI